MKQHFTGKTHYDTIGWGLSEDFCKLVYETAGQLKLNFANNLQSSAPMDRPDDKDQSLNKQDNATEKAFKKLATASQRCNIDV